MDQKILSDAGGPVKGCGRYGHERLLTLQPHAVVRPDYQDTLRQCNYVFVPYLSSAWLSQCTKSRMASKTLTAYSVKSGF